MTPEKSLTYLLAELTGSQIDGLECVLCGRMFRGAEMSPAGRIGQHVLFRCFPDCPKN